MRFTAFLVAALVASCCSSAAAAPVTPLTGTYSGTDSQGRPVTFRVTRVGGNPPQLANIFTAAGTYAAVCNPLGTFVGPFIGGRCKGGPYPVAGREAAIASLDVQGVYADGTQDDTNDAVFTGTISSSLLFTDDGTTIASPTVSWRAQLVNPAAKGSPDGAVRSGPGGTVSVPVRCVAKGVSVCSGTVTVVPSGSAAAGRRSFRIRTGASERVSVKLLDSVAARLGREGNLPVSVRVRTALSRTRTVVTVSRMRLAAF